MEMPSEAVQRIPTGARIVQSNRVDVPRQTSFQDRVSAAGQSVNNEKTPVDSAPD